MSSIVECRQLTKRFGAKLALEGVSFTLDHHQTVALVGPNGAGKTTLFSILCGYLRPNQGQVSLFGHQPGSRPLLGRIAALPQDAQLDPRLTIAEQLSLFARLQGFTPQGAKTEAERVLELVQLGDVLHDRPDALSHGMRKRAGIAQALIGQPELLLLDEPTAGLDPANARHIRQLVAGLSDKITILISSHNLSELERLCSKVLLLEQGRLTEQAVDNQVATPGYLTLILEPQQDSDPLPILQGIAGIIEISRQQKNEYLIHYDSERVPDMDLQLMQCLNQHHWPYRQLVRGRSLEEQLFSTP